MKKINWKKRYQKKKPNQIFTEFGTGRIIHKPNIGYVEIDAIEFPHLETFGSPIAREIRVQTGPMSITGTFELTQEGFEMFKRIFED